MRQFNLFLVIAALAFLSPACSKNNTDVPMQNNIKTDVELLRKFIQLPKEPLTVKWQTEDAVPLKSQFLAPGPTDWNLVAILEFKPNDLAELTASTDVIDNKEAAVLLENFMRDWVEQALGAGSKKVNKHYSFDGTVRNADIFAREPLLHGYWVQLQDNTILLLLHTK